MGRKRGRVVSRPKEINLLVEDYPNSPPSLCLLCEGAEPGAKFLRTGRMFEAGPFNPMSGHKYVCSYCTRDAADAFGMFEELRNNQRIVNDEYDKVVAELEEKLKGFAMLQDFLEKFAPDALAPKPKPAKKTLAPKPTKPSDG